MTGEGRTPLLSTHFNRTSSSTHFPDLLWNKNAPGEDPVRSSYVPHDSTPRRTPGVLIWRRSRRTPTTTSSGLTVSTRPWCPGTATPTTPSRRTFEVLPYLFDRGTGCKWTKDD